MSSKKDLTRIEDLNSFLHQEDDAGSFELPGLPGDDTPELTEDPMGTTDEVPEVPEGPTFETFPENPTEPALELDAEFGNEEVSFTDSSPSFEMPVETVQEEAREADFEPESYPDSEILDSPEPDPLPVVETPSYSPENLSDVRDFAEKAQLSDSSTECNPAFSVIARNIKFIEDLDEIMGLMKDLGFGPEVLSGFKKQLERGTLLIPRISEFAAVYVCHQLRKMDLELQMGLSDLLHPPKLAEGEDRGLVSKRSLGQNYDHNFAFKADTDQSRSIILSTLAHLDGHHIVKYLGVATEHSLLPSEVVESESSETIHQSYDELAQKLKAHALAQNANAVVGINYHLTPLPSESLAQGLRYKLTCTGNMVWVNRLSE